MFYINQPADKMHEQFLSWAEKLTKGLVLRIPAAPLHCTTSSLLGDGPQPTSLGSVLVKAEPLHSAFMLLETGILHPSDCKLSLARHTQLLQPPALLQPSDTVVLRKGGELLPDYLGFVWILG